MRFPFALAALLLLSACWEGAGLYTAADARPAIAPGLYRTVDEAGRMSTSTYRVSIQTDGMTRVQETGTRDDYLTVGFAPLDPRGDTFAAWANPNEATRDGGRVFYGLLRRGAHGGYVYIMPGCPMRAALVTAAGGQALADGTDRCTFTSRASVEAALRSLPADAEPVAEVVRLEPVREGEGPG